jgi:signal peptidase I
MAKEEDLLADYSPRELIRETSKLLRRSRKRLADSRYEEIERTIEEAKAARKSNDPKLDALLEKLAGYIRGPLNAARKSKSRELFESVFFAVIIALCIRAFIFELFKIPSPSMVPTLMVGDRLVVEKYAYGIRIPFSTEYLVQWDTPERSEVVVFQFPRLYAQTRNVMGPAVASLDEMSASERPQALDEMQPFASEPGLLNDAWGNPFRYEVQQGGYVLRSSGPDGTFDTSDDITEEQVRASLINRPSLNGRSQSTPCRIHEASMRQRSRTYIKRVVGMPSDTVELRGNELIINGERREITDVQSRTERVQGGVMIAHYGQEHLTSDGSHAVRYYRENRDFGPVTVPEDHLLMLGDNRDESSDGRCWGFVPIEHVKGRATRIAFSTAESSDSSIIQSLLDGTLFHRSWDKIE